MTSPDKRKRLWPAGVFEPPVDFYALLDAHAAKVLEGMEALMSWLDTGAADRCERVRQLEKQADEMKMNLERKLVQTFVTPFDREEIYDLSARLDEVINAAKSIVREIEALEVSPEDSFLRPMAELLLEGTRCLQLSFAALKSNPKEASAQAFLARKSENRFAKVYRQAMRQLFQLDDFKKVLKTREVYRYMMMAAEKIDVVAESLLHVIIKIS